MSIGWALYLAGNMFILGYIVRYELEGAKLNKMSKTLVRERLMLNEILKRVEKNPEEFSQDEVNNYKNDDYLLKVRMKTFDKAYLEIKNIL